MDSALTVYIDFKSPYAYLAIEPTRRLAQELGIAINWLPFVIDIPSYLGSASLDASGNVAKASRSEFQWSWVKYAYYDCRRYANLRDMMIRGTVKIWDTHLAAIGMLWAKEQGDDILQRYIDGVYVPFWKRELDIENMDVVQHVLQETGASLSGFKAFADPEKGRGAQANFQLQQNVFEGGIFGVPTYVLGDDMYFGREHLPRIRWQLQGEQGPAPDIAYQLLPGDRVESAAERRLDVGIGLEDPETMLVIPCVLRMAQDLGLAINWYALPQRKHGERHHTDEQSRSARHQRYRRENRRRDRARYLDETHLRETAAQIGALLKHHKIALQAGGSVDGAEAAAYMGGPVFILGEEVFIGRQHLPLLRARLELIP